MLLISLAAHGQSISDYQKVIDRQDKLEQMLKAREPIKTHDAVICLAISAIMKGSMDWQTDDPNSYPLTKYNLHFWSHAGDNWMNVKRIKFIDYPLDAWHIEGTIMILCISKLSADLIHHQYPLIKNHPVLDKIVWTAICGFFYDGIFYIAYKKH